MQVFLNVSYLNDYGNEGLLATWANEKATSGVGSAFSATVVSGGVTGIEDVFMDDNDNIINDSWYTINGVKLNGKPTEKGIYIHRGRKVVVK